MDNILFGLATLAICYLPMALAMDQIANWNTYPPVFFVRWYSIVVPTFGLWLYLTVGMLVRDVNQIERSRDG
jgi:hypothetical protein